MLGIYEDWGSELVNTTDSIHNTPLHIAAKKGNISSLKVRRERESKREGKERTEREKEEIIHVQYIYITYIGVAQNLSFKD